MSDSHTLPYTRPGRWKPSLMLVPLLSLVFMMACFALYQPLWERAFRSDDSPVSWLSSTLLFANAVVALVLALQSVIPARLSGAMSLGLLWCALDEQFMFHERFKYRYVHAWFPDGGFGSWLADLPLALVGVGGAICVAWFARAMRKRSAVSCVLMLTGLALGGLALAVDGWGESWPVAPFEEGIEALAESFFLSALLAAAQVQSRSS